ncbi:MAG TPA: acyltransferase family protein [Ktedonobacteraceae bacterium]|nr:acyltransferase family protein [Ktedonobacteraceae bacterium]
MASQTELTTSRLPGAAGTTPAGPAALAQKSRRLLFVDNLRILLICGVVVQHLSVTYGAAGSWMYTDPATDQFASTFLSVYNLIPMAVGMGFFFLLAGYFTPTSYDRKGGAAFVRDRIIRLGIPWLVYSLLLEPLVIYIAHGLSGSFWSFYSVYLRRVDSIAEGPIWFVELLLFFSILYVAWRWLTRSRLSAFNRTGAVPGPWAISGFILGLGLASFVVRIWWPQYEQPGPLNLPLGYLLQYACFFILGIVAYRSNWLFKLTSRMGRGWALIALLATLPFFGLVLPYLAITGRQAVIDMMGGWHWLSLVYALWESFVIVGVCIGLLVVFRQCLNHQGRLARSLVASAYTVYLIHPLVLVGFACAFNVVALYPLLKFGIAVLVTLPLCFLLSGVIRKIPLVNRVL